jgi:hypothetical protein
MQDPTISGLTYSQAYLAGYRAQIEDKAASDYALRAAIAHHDDYWTRSTR